MLLALLLAGTTAAAEPPPPSTDLKRHVTAAPMGEMTDKAKGNDPGEKKKKTATPAAASTSNTMRPK